MGLLRLPEPVLCEILLCLDLKDCIRCFARVCKRSHSVCVKKLIPAFAAKYYIEKPLTNAGLALARGLSSLEEPKPVGVRRVAAAGYLDITCRGFATTGGVEDDQRENWVGNFYRQDSSRYSSFSNQKNITTAGMVELDSTKLASSLSSFDSMKTLRRYSGNPCILADNTDTRKVDSEGVLFVATQLVIGRTLTNSCPVKSFMVLVSTYYVDVESNEFNQFNDLNTWKDLQQFLATHPELKHSGPKHHNGNVFVTFDWSSGPLKPLAWGQFEATTSGCQLTLNDYFSGSYLYTKLMDFERSSQFPYVTHIDWNIAATYVGLKGITVQVGS